MLLVKYIIFFELTIRIIFFEKCFFSNFFGKRNIGNVFIVNVLSHKYENLQVGNLIKKRDSVTYETYTQIT